MIDMVSSNNTFANNSMIFKTIDSSVDNTRKTLALFNKDWNTYKTNWQQGFSQNGVAGGIKSIFQSSNSNSVISKEQLQILRNWNNAVAHGCTNQETFNRIIKDADSNTKLYFSGLNKGKGSVEGLKNAQNVAKQSTIGLTLAQTALNAAISLGFTAALMLAVKGLDKLINSAKRASEAADEAFSDTTEKVQKNEEEAKSLDELISKYKELKESENLDVDGRKEIKEIQNDIADLVGVQASNLDLVNGKLDDEIAKLDEISAKEAKNAYETTTANYNNSKKATDKAAGDDSFLFVDGYSYTGKREKEAEKVLKNAGFGGNVQSGGFFGNTLFVMDSFDNDMKELKGAQEKADYLQSMIDVLEQNGQRATDLYAGLISQRDKYLQYIDNQQDAANSLVNSWISYSQFSNDELSKINVDSLDSFEEYRQKMIEEAKNDESIGKMLADGTLSDEDLENAVNDFMATSTKFSTWYEQWIGNIESDVQHETPISQSISDTIDQLNTQLKPAMDSLKSAYENIFTEKGFTLDNVDISMLDNIKSKLDELNENGVSIDYSSFETLATVLTDTTSSADDVHNAFNNVATDIVSSLNPAIGTCSGENYKLIQSLLESVGIINSEQVMISSLGYSYEEYIAAKEEAKNAGLDLANATEDEINAFVNEAIESGNCGQALALLQLKKLLVNSTQINTASDVQQIMNLASAAGMGAEVLTQLANAKSILSTVENGGTVSLSSYEKALSDVENAKQTMLDWKPVEIDFSPASNNKSAGSAGKEAADAYVEQFEKELAVLDDLRSRGIIDESTYLSKLKALYEKYFKGKKQYLDEYNKYERQYLEKSYDLYGSALSGITKLMGKQIDAYSEEKEVAVSSLEEERDARLAVIDAQKEQLQSQIDLIEKQIDEKQKEIDAINDAADARKRELDLQKAQYELERARNQRTKLVKICQTL